MKTIKKRMNRAFKDYFSEKSHFSDMINAVLFNGEQLISPQDLRIYNPDKLLIHETRFANREKDRDVYMVYKNELILRILWKEEFADKDGMLLIGEKTYATCYDEQLDTTNKLISVYSVGFCVLTNRQSLVS